MKKLLALILALSVVTLAAGCCVAHDWREAACEAPETCETCGKIRGEALGHDWQEASCEAPALCSRCGAAQGAPRGHLWTPGDCTRPETCENCGAAAGTALGHDLHSAAPKGGEFTGICSRCGQVPQEAVDWTLYGPRLLEGTWMASRYTIGADLVLPREGDGISFYEDGTLLAIRNQERLTGTWSYTGYSLEEGDASGVVLYDITIDGEHYYFNGIEEEEPDVLSLTGNQQILRYER